MVGVPARDLDQLSCALFGGKPQIDVEALNSFVNWKSLCLFVAKVLEHALHFTIFFILSIGAVFGTIANISLQYTLPVITPKLP